MMEHKLDQEAIDKFQQAMATGLDPIEMRLLAITERELMEIKHCLFYALECNHGTAGHNQIMLIDKFARHLGFGLELTDGVPVFEVRVPAFVEVKG